MKTRRARKMKYADVPKPMREAIGTFEMLRRLGFESNDIFFYHNGDEPEGGSEPKNMMFVCLKTQGREFFIRVGVVDLPYRDWAHTWQAVAMAVRSGTLPKADAERMVSECDAFLQTKSMVRAMLAKGITVPHPYAIIAAAPDAPEDRSN